MDLWLTNSLLRVVLGGSPSRESVAGCPVSQGVAARLGLCPWAWPCSRSAVPHAAVMVGPTQAPGDWGFAVPNLSSEAWLRSRLSSAWHTEQVHQGGDADTSLLRQEAEV